MPRQPWRRPRRPAAAALALVAVTRRVKQGVGGVRVVGGGRGQTWRWRRECTGRRKKARHQSRRRRWRDSYLVCRARAPMTPPADTPRGRSGRPRLTAVRRARQPPDASRGRGGGGGSSGGGSGRQLPGGDAGADRAGGSHARGDSGRAIAVPRQQVGTRSQLLREAQTGARREIVQRSGGTACRNSDCRGLGCAGFSLAESAKELARLTRQILRTGLDLWSNKYPLVKN